MRDYRLLTNDELIKENQRLSDIIKRLQNELNEYSKCTARCYPPTRTYKELEEKLAQAEELRQKDIDELVATKITPLNKEIIRLTQQLTISHDVNQRQNNRIKELEIIINNLNSMINFAVGYISGTQSHTDKHPMEVKQWLFKGFEGLLDRDQTNNYQKKENL